MCRQLCQAQCLCSAYVISYSNRMAHFVNHYSAGIGNIQKHVETLEYAMFRASACFAFIIGMFALAATIAYLVIQTSGLSVLPNYLLGFALFTLILTASGLLLSTINNQINNSNVILCDRRPRLQRTNKPRCCISDLDFTESQAECVKQVVEAKTVEFIGERRKPMGLSRQLISSACGDSSNEAVIRCKSSIHEQ